MMNEYRFHLEKYRLGNRYTCPNCERKRCFTRYIDDEGEVSFPDNVGKCDHEHSCGYHYTPKDYFREHPDFLSKDKLPYTDKKEYPTESRRKAYFLYRQRYYGAFLVSLRNQSVIPVPFQGLW